ncbi:MAG: M67 family metallopeptidase [Pseudomonadota bacterium]
MSLFVTSDVIDAIQAAARAAHPEECCGLLLGETSERITRAAPTQNVHPNPARAFEIDPQALIDAHRAQRGGGPLLIGHYHSHPTGDPRPSAIDAAHAPGDGLIWAICAKGRVEFWRDSPEGFETLSYSTLDP